MLSGQKTSMCQKKFDQKKFWVKKILVKKFLNKVFEAKKNCIEKI